ncbi:SDR family oxidoreductase [Pelagibacterales bacterium]|nr:SDR family oxidoreductase [Pelagibacterales bacterium]
MTYNKKNIVILGVSGLNGNAIFNYLIHNKKNDYNVIGTYCNNNLPFKKNFNVNTIFFDCLIKDSLSQIFEKYKPSIVINCIGVTKHLFNRYSNEDIFYINSELPYILLSECNKNGSRLIHLSTDCVFSGIKGNYNEQDIPDAKDIYGLSKAKGEFNNNKHLTIRTSVIGHEVISSNGLLEWFLSQSISCDGFVNAIFSGLTTFELSKVISNIILVNEKIFGLYNIGGYPINKYDLLNLFAEIYGKDIHIYKNEEFIMDRSFNSTSFSQLVNYNKKNWKSLIIEMKHEECSYSNFYNKLD